MLPDFTAFAVVQVAIFRSHNGFPFLNLRHVRLRATCGQTLSFVHNGLEQQKATRVPSVIEPKLRTQMIKRAHDNQHNAAETNWWSEDYRGRPIAIFNHYGRLHVYLDHVLQHNVVFDSGEAALAWLRQRIDQGVPARVN